MENKRSILEIALDRWATWENTRGALGQTVISIILGTTFCTGIYMFELKEHGLSQEEQTLIALVAAFFVLWALASSIVAAIFLMRLYERYNSVETQQQPAQKEQKNPLNDSWLQFMLLFGLILILIYFIGK